MYPTIKNGEVIGVEPVKPSQVKRGDIILYWNGRGVIAHRVIKIKKAVSSQRSAVRHQTSDIRHQRTAISGQHSAISSHDSKPNPHHEILSIRHSSSTLEPSAVRSEHSALSIEQSSPGLEHSALSFEHSFPHPSTLSSRRSVVNRNHSTLDPQSSIFGNFFILRGDASAVCDEPITAQQVLGKVVFVERDGCLIPLDNTKSKISQAARLYTYRIKRAISNRLSAIIYRRRKSYKIDPCGP
jgi:hypothetical protein